MIGMNLAGAEFGNGSRYGYDYIYPTAGELDYFKAEGMDLIRLPFRWERVQPALGGELNPEEVGRIVTFLDEAQARGMHVVLDVHNYGRYNGQVIGSDIVPASAFADFWSKLSSALKDHPAIYGFGLMNEPHDMGSADAWPTAAQAAVNAIRATGAAETILVSGNAWSSAHLWPTANANLLINDPLNNLKYEAHVYFDDDHTGTYDESYLGEGATPNIGVERLQPFLNWLQEHNAQGFIGEFGVPGDDPRWLAPLEKFVDELHARGLDGTAWAAGPWWGDYPLSLEPANGHDKPQMDVLTKYAYESTAEVSHHVTPGASPGAEIFDLAPPSHSDGDGHNALLSDVQSASDESSSHQPAPANGMALNDEPESGATSTASGMATSTDPHALDGTAMPDWLGSHQSISGPGSETLISGPGDDTFVFHGDFGHKTIVDFAPGDTVEFEHALFTDVDAILAASVQVGDDVVIAPDADNAVVLKGVMLSSLTPDDFSLV
jgi:aryl-phospho-beta-D-glucosidase BglC (GH1 family)